MTPQNAAEVLHAMHSMVARHVLGAEIRGDRVDALCVPDKQGRGSPKEPRQSDEAWRVGEQNDDDHVDVLGSELGQCPFDISAARESVGREHLPEVPQARGNLPREAIEVLDQVGHALPVELQCKTDVTDPRLHLRCTPSVSRHDTAAIARSMRARAFP